MSNHWLFECYMVRMTLKMFKHAFEHECLGLPLLVFLGLWTMNALHTHAFLHWVLLSAVGSVFALSSLGVAEGEVCGCTKVHTMCSLMQHYREMSRHFGKLNTCIHGHERIAGSTVG